MVGAWLNIRTRYGPSPQKPASDGFVLANSNNFGLVPSGHNYRFFLVNPVLVRSATRKEHYKNLGNI